jgi:hypothetical protein
MRGQGREAILVALLAVAAAAAASLPGRADTPQDAPPEPPTPNCANSCRGLGIEKVKAGDEHCGLIPRERKDESLDAACSLAESHREQLQATAETRARRKCSEQLDQEACSCRTELRPWQNVYTHVFSQRCWAECGWAFLIECGRRPAADDG